MTDQTRRHAGLDILEFVVDRLECDGNPLLEVLVGGLDVKSLAANDQAH
jgi:hypothetical protein